MANKSNNTKVVFASDEWVSLAADLLKPLVKQYSYDGLRFSFCETYTNVPDKIGGDTNGSVSWYFQIKSFECICGGGILDNADRHVTLEYKKADPHSRTLYRLPETFTPKADRNASADKPPAFLALLHNALAVRTLESVMVTYE